MMTERNCGLLVHPTSFPSKYGIGDLGKGAYDFIDFLFRGKQRFWQILPLGPTGFGDSPYQCYSAFAGNYLLIDISCLVDKNLLHEEDIFPLPEFNAEKAEYSETAAYKKSVLRKAFERFGQLTDKAEKTRFTRFCNQNSEWLNDYCMFIALKEYFVNERKYIAESVECIDFKKRYDKLLPDNLADDYYYGGVWSTWPEGIKTRESAEMKKWNDTLAVEISFQKFLQYEFFNQWNKLKKYAESKKIKIIGDIPIFVAYDSADVWANKELFYLDKLGLPASVAGVPPDYFSETGQLWGNPLYNWPRMAKDGYNWWIKRIEFSLSLVDMIRIDHFRGFESYWSIPFGEETAEKGKWVKGPGKNFFKLIESKLGKLPIIAEDLGIITDKVINLRESVGFPGMKVLHFAFFPERKSPHLPQNYRSQNYVVYTGTHDNDTTVGWYRSMSEESRDLFRRYLNVSGEDCSWDLIRLAYMSSAAIAIVPIQDVLGLSSEYRMNTPGKSSGNWQFRFTEEMLKPEYAEGLAYLAELYER